ncbi:MAG: hypothetical protein DWQ01_09865 [Planctomycetota bacterium]|nr:MAG: hypothetical protein DWQ01_09865 [Planctomycetota bacterium]
MSLRVRVSEAGAPDQFDLLPFVSLMMVVLATLLFITMAVASVNLGAGAAEGWIPMKDEEATQKTPVLVEWDGDSAIIHRTTGKQAIQLGEDPERWFAQEHRPGALSPTWDFRNREMKSCLQELEKQKTSHYVLFAVRPSGFDNFQSLASIFRDRDVGIGYEPLEQGKVVRLRLNEGEQ